MSGYKIFVAGHNGMVGSSIVRSLKKKKNIDLIIRERNEVDLTNQTAVKKFFKKEKIDQIYMAAAKAGGIYANNVYPAEFIYENIMIETNIINSAFENGIKKILFLGSSCIYPRTTKQPIKEEQLLTGLLEQTNEPYSIAKIAGVKLCESYNRQYGKSHGIDYRTIMPTNLYGPGDNYHPLNSHVVPALIKKFHEAKISKKKIVKVWGTGNAKREFLYVDDLAEASIHVMNLSREKYKKITNDRLSHINIGSGYDLTINKLAKIIMKIIDHKVIIKFDKSKPDGMKRKILDSKKINKLGWKPKVDLIEGLIKTYKSFKETL